MFQPSRAEKPGLLEWQRFQGGIVVTRDQKLTINVEERINSAAETSPKERIAFYSELLFSLLQDVGATRADFVYVSNRISAEGESFFTNALPSLAKGLYASLAAGYWINVPTFGRRGGNYYYPRFLSGLFAKVFQKGDPALVRDEPCATSIKFVNQLCQFFYKADTGSMDPQLVHDKLVGMVATEESLHRTEENLEVTFNSDGLAKDMLRISRDILGQLPSPPSEFVGRNGPGAVADLSPSESKFEANIPYHPKYVDLIDVFSPFFNDTDKFESRSYRYPSLSDMLKPSWAHVSSITSETVCVPKDARGPRIIGKEPWFLQFMQQGLKSWLYEVVQSECFSTRGYVNFDDQSVNQNMVRTGSLDKSWSTLDLKDASDRVTLSLVQKLFAGNPYLLSLLEKTRSELTSLRSVKAKYHFDDLPDVVTLRKFAPMGSALCFPIMALSVYCACMSRISLSTGRPWTDHLGDVYVYGDDVVVRTEYADLCKEGLAIFGLAVNDQKSFVDSYLLESCGVDCYKGWEISPVRLKDVPSEFRRKDDGSGLTILASLISKANNLIKRGYIFAGEYLLSKCEKTIGIPLPFVSPSSGVFGREVHSSLYDDIANINICDERIPYVRTPFQQTAFRAFALRAQELSVFSTGYGHLCRTWGQLGTGSPLPSKGLFSAQHKVILVRVNWVPELPTSQWVP